MFDHRQSTPSPRDDTPPSASAVTLEAVDVHRNGRLALRDVTFELAPGSLTAVIGPNGAGKSSLFGAISGRLRQSRGTVAVQGDVAEVLQTTQLDEELPLTVDDVVRIGRYPTAGLLRPMRRHDKDIVDEALARVDLMALRRRPITELSGGQRQRALVAQGLAQQAAVLILDEPTAGLDRPSQQQVLEIVQDEADRGVTVLFATHDLNEAAIADNVVALACDCVCCAPPIAALRDPAVTALFAPVPPRLDEAAAIAAANATSA